VPPEQQKIETPTIWEDKELMHWWSEGTSGIAPAFPVHYYFISNCCILGYVCKTFGVGTGFVP
jgi:hypothetical protein